MHHVLQDDSDEAAAALPANVSHGTMRIRVTMHSVATGEEVLRHEVLVLTRAVIIDRTFRFYSSRTEHLRQTVRSTVEPLLTLSAVLEHNVSSTV